MLAEELQGFSFVPPSLAVVPRLEIVIVVACDFDFVILVNILVSSTAPLSQGRDWKSRAVCRHLYAKSAKSFDSYVRYRFVLGNPVHQWPMFMAALRSQ